VGGCRGQTDGVVLSINYVNVDIVMLYEYDVGGGTS
jgi:hypothetical protein